MKRRTFLLAGAAAAAGGLVIGYRAWTDGFKAEAAALTTGDGGRLIAGWVKIGSDDTVTVYVPHVDMGQGTHTALAMILAEELDADWSKVRTERAPGEKAFANRFLAQGWVLQGWRVPRFLDAPVEATFTEAARFINLQITGGSTAVRFTGQGGLRVVGAAARVMLLEAAARRLGVPAVELVTRDGVVTHARSGRTLRYGELAAEASGLPVPADPPMKPPAQYRLVGTSLPRLDIPAKVTGAPLYAIDLRLPGMRYAAVMAPPVHGGRLASVDPAPARAVQGVEQVLTDDDGIAVIAGSWWQAQKALGRLRPVFTDGGNGSVSTEGLFAAQARVLASGEGKVMHEAGDAEAALRQAGARVVEASYRVPFLHHAAMEPINLTAQLKDGRLTVWSGEQDALGAKMRVAKIAGLPAERVAIEALPVGGSFGRRVAFNHPRHLQQAVHLARAASPNPVQMIWSREEDFAQGTYRPQVSTRIRAALAPDGTPAAWSQVFIDTPGRNEAYGLPYRIPHQSIRSVPLSVHVAQGSWRSVAHTQHGFYTETFIDELAHAAGRDPFAYRRDLLAPESRHARVLVLAAERAGWGGPLPPGRGRGIALVESFGSVVAQVIEASLENGAPRVHRVVAAVDCGGVCHPDTATQQVEGAIVMGLGAAIAERIDVESGAVRQRNFADYRIAGMADTPPSIEVHFLAGDGPWGGLGEPGLPPVAPALGNALFAASGQRARSLPLLGTAGA